MATGLTASSPCEHLLARVHALAAVVRVPASAVHKPLAGTSVILGVVAQVVAAVPVGERLGRVAPRGGVVEHDVIALRRLRQRVDYRGGVQGCTGARGSSERRATGSSRTARRSALCLAGRRLVSRP